MYVELLLATGIQPKVLIHDLQNHDEFSYQLPELEVSHESVDYQGRRKRARAVQKKVLGDMRARFANKSWAELYRREQDGVATTMVGFLSACLNYNLYEMTEQQKECVKKLHLLAVRLNAMQPGVFCLSMWDLVGAFPLRKEDVKDRTGGEDYRWINRGGVDLTGKYESSDWSCWKLPRAETLYGSVTDQLSTPTSFASHVQHMLKARRSMALRSES